MMNALAENCALQLRGEHIWQQQIGHGLQTVSSGEMSGNIHSKIAELLNQSPNFRTAGTDLGRDLRSAYDDSGVSHEKTHNATQSRVGLRRELMGRGHSCTRTPVW